MGRASKEAGRNAPAGGRTSSQRVAVRHGGRWVYASCAALVTLAVVALGASRAPATILLNGDFIQLPIDDTGLKGQFMATGATQGARYNPAGTGGSAGTDFWVFGSPVYNYTVAIGGSTFLTNGLGWFSGPLVTDTSTGSTNSAVITGTPAPGLSFTRAVSFADNAHVVTVTDTLTNTGSTAVLNVATLDNTDPDQDQPFSGSFSTANDVVSVSTANDLVVATGVTSGLTVGFGSPSPLRTVDASGFSNTNPYSIIAAPLDPNGFVDDIGIDLAINYGTLAAGQSRSVIWYLVFGSSKTQAIAHYQAVIAVCGNNAVESGEECDDGNLVSGDGCDSNCTATRCGNAVVSVGEQCDDGNAVASDGCDAACQVEVGWACPTPGGPCQPICGDGLQRGSEACDDGNLVSGDGCDANCTPTGCGNGIATSGEQCDDGNAVDTDACKSDCMANVCGDGFVNTGVEQCDDGNASNTDACKNDCTFAVCGDGVQAFFEQCDDGNFTNGDGCDFNCTLTACGNGITTFGEQCDDGNTNNADTCKNDCTFAVCGDGVQAFFEQCDDGNASNEDSCRNDCRINVCPDGFLNVGVEQCDDGNIVNTDACTNNCTFNVCGDGALFAGVEQCDDGNTNDNDACKNDCTANVCGDGSLQTTGGAYGFAAVPFGYIDISGGATAVPLGDDQVSIPIALGFTFNFFGRPYSQVSISSNGFLTFDQFGSSGCCSGHPLPSVDPPNNLIAGFWTDLLPAGPSSYQYARVGDVFVVDANVPLYGDPSIIERLQFHLHAHTDRIEIHYLNVQPGFQGVTAGIENSDGTIGRQHYFGSGALVNQAVAYVPLAAELCDDGNLVDGDGCDSNCTPTGCGNGVRTTGEQCDDGNAAAGDGCDAVCQAEPGWTCPPSGPCQPICGDGVLRGAEECDDNNLVDGDGCDSNCTTTRCGNGVATAPEQCDDGNSAADDACKNDCTLNTCGDGVVRSGVEQCDDGNTSSNDACKSDCTFNTCGDGVLNAGVEQCDDGNFIPGDGCDPNCRPTGCPNGFLTAGEQCDDGNLSNGDGCDVNCTFTRCGNGVISVGEQCDDGNLINGDGCDANCRPTGCGNGIVGGNEQCDDGNTSNNDACTTLCRFNVCGDGAVRTGVEQCDDGNASAGDGCTGACVRETGWTCPSVGGACLPICGDGLRLGVEQCDDGNVVDGDGCDGNCTTTGCGNGITTVPEQCDDGNSNKNDACKNDCTLNVCGDGVTRTGVELCDDGNGASGDGCSADCRRETEFTCYRTHTTPGTRKFTAQRAIGLSDAFGPLTVDVKKSMSVCNPTDRNDQDPVAPSLADHLAQYRMTVASRTARFTPRLNQRVANPFGTLTLDLIKPVRLLAPSSQNRISPPPPLSGNLVDHFACYKARVSRGAPAFVAVRGVTAVRDEFGALAVDLTKPTMLCAPSSVANEQPSALTHRTHLLCYRAVVPSSSPRFSRIPAMYVRNRFGPETLDALKPSELCVPAQLLP